MKLQKAPILHLFKLETDPKNHDNLVQNVLSSQFEKNALFVQSGHETGNKNYAVECFQDEEHYQAFLNSAEYQKALKAAHGILINRVDVELQPEFISTKAEELNISGPNDYVVYMTEIGVQLGKGDEFANGVLKEMKTAVESEEGIMAMIAGTVMNQPNEWLSLEVYKTEEAYKSHLETKHFKKYLEATKYCVESKGLHLLKPDIVFDKGEIFYRP
ncbi:antibiotic biosynthesis monooxygenase [Lactobacillus ultunensis]|uniref:Antibiotic biosynthesis monooxygenase n=1 Tax=Lactobacillus ultunensis DSM 16047 TaxID=525365 RepID=C2EK92_9LACO|nr:antibiotic biosynthesis monooxygenase [Lactobacillus ultunensis]EEJ73107.1 antibiotic biosynthesis monooxygenase [Lactobacillus ultunensis DSM 16047]KRL82624.1 antibiotic biosynthesis monooxygenase [Lactobacillus ultunensis DSM 16047]QQP29376.1 antibiotic biosynthesis monooxygenase [Lactobacillus ultunensis]